MAHDDAVVDRFKEWLRDRGLPATAQRIAIAEVLLGADQHLSADDVCAALAQRGTKAGTATVYRTIDVLMESGLVIERDFGEGFRRFEPAQRAEAHERLICTACGRVEAVPDTRLERVAAELATAHGFTADRHRFVVYGRCRSCQTALPS